MNFNTYAQYKIAIHLSKRLILYRIKHTWNKFNCSNNSSRHSFFFFKNLTPQNLNPRPSFKILLRRNIMSRLLASFLSRLLSKLIRARNKFLPRLGARKIFSKQKRCPQTRFYATTATRSDFPGRNLFRRMIVRFFFSFRQPLCINRFCSNEFDIKSTYEISYSRDCRDGEISRWMSR